MNLTNYDGHRSYNKNIYNLVLPFGNIIFRSKMQLRSLRCYNIILGKFRLDEYCGCCFCCYLIYVCVGFTCVGMYITTGELTISPSTCCLANQAFISILFTMVCCSTLKYRLCCIGYGLL